MASLKDLERQLLALKKQIPFATARALTSTARKIQEAQKDNLESKLDNPTPFTVNSVASTAARKTNLTAKVFIRPTAAEYLAPEEFGGTRHLSGKALLNPKGVRLNKYGNLPKGKLASLKANPNVFVGSVNGASGFWQRKKYKPVTGKKKGKRSKNGTRKPRPKQPKLKLLVRFGDAQEASPTLGYFELANQMASDLLPGEMSAAISEALRTAK
ncbi:hypothetical protein [Enterobacter asburiae]|uniref:hypothetical protein n=1 Tax=Enterobacter asburiae TaxID=61645 RepID=UPI001CFA5D7F|nr:hypothetical protein [Enterobacter asburiae]MCB4615326.1 hypothetical protein [Enterobacter asburiae]